MASISETGHAKNVANFEDLIAFVAGYGATYSPSKTSLELSGLNTAYTDAQAGLAAVTSKKTDYNNAVNNRIAAFSNLRSLATRLVNALEATDAAPEKIKDAKGFNRKLQGKRAENVTGVQPIAPDALIPAAISTSQQSYDQLIEHFAGLISTLQSETSYAPNEADLKITALNTKLADLKAKNAAVSNAYASVSNARITRNNSIYGANTGIVEIAGEVKSYIKSIFGANSPEFSQVKGIKFTHP
jgi:hypothetical protein